MPKVGDVDTVQRVGPGQPVVQVPVEERVFLYDVRDEAQRAERLARGQRLLTRAAQSVHQVLDRLAADEATR